VPQVQVLGPLGSHRNSHQACSQHLSSTPFYRKSSSKDRSSIRSRVQPTPTAPLTSRLPQGAGHKGTQRAWIHQKVRPP
jgi:hypothetical protein